MQPLFVKVERYATPSKYYFIPLVRVRFPFMGMNLSPFRVDPFQRGFEVEENKQKVSKIVSPVCKRESLATESFTLKQ